jgi:hypothetical protein
MQCALCNSFDLILLNDGKKTYRRCKNCDYIFLDRAFILSPQEEKIRYSFHNNDIENEGYVAMFERFFDKVLPFLGEVHTILDFGCGPGPVMAELLKRRGYELSLYDKYFHDDTNNLYKPHDCVISTEVFEHLANPLEHLKILIRNSLKAQGIIALMTQFHPNDDVSFLQWYYKLDETHIGFFSPKTFEYIAQKLGLKILFIDGKDTVVFQKLF